MEEIKKDENQEDVKNSKNNKKRARKNKSFNWDTKKRNWRKRW